MSTATDAKQNTKPNAKTSTKTGTKTGTVDKWVLVTGATDGIGRVTAEALAHQGLQVVIVGRNVHKTERVAHEITASGFLVADLSVLSEVKRLADEYKQTFGRLDVLVNNVGAMFQQRKETKEGIERTFALNHLAPFVLTTELLPLLRESSGLYDGGGRVVTVASMAHEFVRFRFADPELKSKYSGWTAYAQSKLANILFTRELARREPSVLCNALHPGMVATNFGHQGGGWLSQSYKLVDLFALSPEQGAQTSVHVASSPDIKRSGAYYQRAQPAIPAPQALDDAAGYRLWQLSEQYAQQHGRHSQHTEQTEHTGK